MKLNMHLPQIVVGGLIFAVLATSGVQAAKLGDYFLMVGRMSNDVAVLQDKSVEPDPKSESTESIAGVQDVTPAEQLQASFKTDASPSGRMIEMRATAYAPGPHDNGRWSNLTYMGTRIRPGVIAVDPNVIPIGSHLYIEGPHGLKMHGVAEDTGGAIKGRRLDIAMNTVSEANDFGIQTVKVYVLD